MNDSSQKKTKVPQSEDRSKPKKRDRSASEERLLNAAEDIFSKHGFKASTTRMIAKKANVNESLIGRYFEGKLGLLFAVIEAHIEKKALAEDLPYPQQATLTEELTAFIDARFTEHCQKNSEFFKIVLSQALVDSKFLKKIREKIPNFHEVRLQERIKILQAKRKVIASCDPIAIVMDIDTHFHGVMFFDLIMSGLEPKIAHANLTRFVRNYAKAFEA